MLIVLDGFGYSEAVEGNAIAAASTPNWDRYWQEAPHTLISGSGTDVGLPDGRDADADAFAHAPQGWQAVARDTVKDGKAPFLPHAQLGLHYSTPWIRFRSC